MAHFAKIDENNFVTQVLVVEPEEVSKMPGTWVQTSYNDNIRKNFAGVGYTYDEARDAFIPPKPYPSWILDEQTCRWQAPVPYPDDGTMYHWDEQNKKWVK